MQQIFHTNCPKQKQEPQSSISQIVDSRYDTYQARTKQNFEIRNQHRISTTYWSKDSSETKRETSLVSPK
jgi:hypothetical protein